ncbi:hypothetical protein B0T20DRAFT_397568 [Sordaria brevicollis]|uniref:Uncharacterized protein n=1 Tax=Sordaria brevicollis TaxID=83679 RepID=A0AAE0NW73_SORBR|nr:hypothetical protein B0T20DRAFT_397568 [Sordaria brevicollis]
MSGSNTMTPNNEPEVTSSMASLNINASQPLLGHHTPEPHSHQTDHTANTTQTIGGNRFQPGESNTHRGRPRAMVGKLAPLKSSNRISKPSSNKTKTKTGKKGRMSEAERDKQKFEDLKRAWDAGRPQTDADVREALRLKGRIEKWRNLAKMREVRVKMDAGLPLEPEEEERYGQIIREMKDKEKERQDKDVQMQDVSLGLAGLRLDLGAEK